MTRLRRLSVMLIAAMLIMAIPGTAFAKKSKGGKYVPTSGKMYYQNSSGQWEDAKQAFSAVFDKSGKVRTVQYTWDGGSKVFNYAWKGENLRTYQEVRKDGNSTYKEAKEYTIKKKKPSRYLYTYEDTDEDGTDKGSSEYVYRWGKKDGSETSSDRNKDNVETGRSANVIILKKGKRAFDWNSNTSYSYYKNGMLKAISKPSLNGKNTTTEEFDPSGYLAKYEYTYAADEDSPAGWTRITYAWSFDAKTKCPVEVVVTETGSDSESSTYKWVFENPMKVKKVRNCDAYGLPVWLGIQNFEIQNFYW